MKSALLVVSLIVVVAYGQLLLAQNSNTTSSEVKELETQQQTKEVQEKALKNASAKPTKQQAQAEVSASKNKAPSKVFIPTEEISEDKPVAFPVDI